MTSFPPPSPRQSPTLSPFPPPSPSPAGASEGGADAWVKALDIRAPLSPPPSPPPYTAHPVPDSPEDTAVASSLSVSAIAGIGAGGLAIGAHGFLRGGVIYSRGVPYNLRQQGGDRFSTRRPTICWPRTQRRPWQADICLEHGNKRNIRPPPHISTAAVALVALLLKYACCSLGLGGLCFKLFSCTKASPTAEAADASAAAGADDEDDSGEGVTATVRTLAKVRLPESLAWGLVGGWTCCCLMLSSTVIQRGRACFTRTAYASILVRDRVSPQLTMQSSP